MSLDVEQNQDQGDEIDLQQLAEGDDKTIDSNENKQQNEPVKLSEIEQRARDQGHRPLEEFDGPEANWKTPEKYLQDGELINKIKSLQTRMDSQQQEFDTRLKNSNKLHKARQESEIKALKEEQRNAVIDSDTNKYDSTQKKIEDLESQTLDDEPVKGKSDPVMAAWEEKNPWINDDSDFKKRPVAQDVWSKFLKSNPEATTEQALIHVDAKLKEVFPENNTNPRREQQNTMENNNRSSGNRKSKELTMNDLTQEERQEWDLFANDMFSEKEFLKTVKDLRA